MLLGAACCQPPRHLRAEGGLGCRPESQRFQGVKNAFIGGPLRVMWCQTSETRPRLAASNRILVPDGALTAVQPLGRGHLPSLRTPHLGVRPNDRVGLPWS